jgi:hypothetical protein
VFGSKSGKSIVDEVFLKLFYYILNIRLTKIFKIL